MLLLRCWTSPEYFSNQITMYYELQKDVFMYKKIK